MKLLRPLYLPVPYQEAGRLILRDGTTATIRLAQPEDQQELGAFFGRLSPESRYQRFLSASFPGPEVLRDLCDSSNPKQRLSLLVTRTVGGAQRIVAAGSFIALDEKTAEVAVAVEDPFQGKGLGTLVLERLALLAVRHGFTHFCAMTLTANRRMIEIFRHSGFPFKERTEDGFIEIDLSVVPNEVSGTRSEMRDRVFTAASLRPFFQPRSVVVVGASRNPSSIGHRIFQAVIAQGFQGPVHAVNRQAATIGPHKAYPSVRDLPEPVDLALIVVPRDAVLSVVDDCAARGVKAVVVITAGFGEVNDAGRELQKRLLEKVRGYGMRMVGPNCLGLLNTHPDVRLNASFSPVFPPPGRIAMSSQSGALGIAVLALARQLDLGISTFISVGNKADISGNDLLQYWDGDENTDVILLYLESFGNPRRFARIARGVSRTKPIVVMKAGRTAAGIRAASSHTAALATSEVAVDALFHQAGIIRVETLEEMFAVASVLSLQPLPRGRRVAILTNAGGPGILCADACEAGGLAVAELSDATRAQLASFLPPAASLTNPVDMIATAGPQHFGRAAQTLLEAAEIDALVAIYLPVGVAEPEAVSRAIAEGTATARHGEGRGKPVLLCTMAERERLPLKLDSERIPVFAFPEEAARALARAAAYAEWRAQPLGVIPDFDDIDPRTARDICQKALERGAPSGTWLSAEETRRVLAALGLPLLAGGLARTAPQAVEIARAIGFPVAVKLASQKIVHKTEIGAVFLDLPNESSVSRAFADIERRLTERGERAAMEGVLVQPMIAGGVEVMVGVAQYPLFGPLLAFGLGGIHVEILGDVRFRITPLTDRDAAEMVREIRGYRLLQGYRGHPPADIVALEEVLLRVSRLVEEIPEISELDLNPIFALPPGQGCRIVDARIRVEGKG